MRGEDNKVLPQTAVLREKKRVSTALIIDKTGAVQFHIVSTWWAKGVILGFGIMLAIIMILVLLVISNKNQLDSIQQEIRLDETNTSCCKQPNSNQ